MLLKIKPNISTRTYFFESDKSRSYITDEEGRYEYMLEKEASDMWYVIFTLQNYEKVFEYAVEKGLDNELQDFLYELEASDLIIFDGVKRKEEKKHIISQEILADKDEFEEEQYKWLIKNNLLQNLSLQLSYKCNLNCIHCFNDKNYNEFELSTEKTKEIIDEAYNLGISAVGITGGECTFNKNFLDIARYVREKKLSLRMLTNGQLLYDNDFFEEVISLYPNMIKISLYSMKPEIHDKMTLVKGSCEKTVYVIKKLREKNMPVTISYLETTENRNEFHDVIRFGDEIGAGVSVSSHFINNPDNNNSTLELSDKELLELYLNDKYPHSPINSHPIAQERNTPICHAGYRSIAVAPNLDVTPCNDFNYILANLKDTSLKEVWNNIIPKFRESFTWGNLKECLKYDYCKYCSYCPTPGYLETGKITESKPCCRNAEAFHKASQILLI